MVMVLGLSGLRNAYTSVLSASGSLAMSGASRCEEALATVAASSATTVSNVGNRRVKNKRFIVWKVKFDVKKNDLLEFIVFCFGQKKGSQQ